ncbi:HpcH/HpaI aldolase/citrate lyase family protein [Plastorhodobacter daqingensis]|uniref:HpcH/HpaI aldolase/citrate lyase family protein n=1 Tax=Plastorhodobacter daqingensis TaxID=1387281 RepID=A0ABW2UNC8_9RHOB
MTEPAIRSLLFVPGDSEKLIAKALASQADAVIVDLEDSVAPENKGRARDVTAEVLGGREPGGKPVFVRVNAFDTGMTCHDLAAVVGVSPWGVVLPKCESMAEIARLSHQLEALEAREGAETGATRIMTVATETAAATLRLGAAEADPTGRLWGMLWGGEDLSATLGAQTNRDDAGSYTFPYQFARSQCLFAANALGVVAVDSVYVDFRDPEGLAAETRQGLRDGFSAKAAIHPAQVEMINEVMTPTPEQLDWARQVTTLLQDRAVARIGSKMVDLAHKRIAERLLTRAAALGR